MSEKLVLTVTGSQKLNCSGCERSAEFILAMVEGVQEAQADHQTQRVVVTYEPDVVTAVKIQAALAEIGYTTTPVAN